MQSLEGQRKRASVKCRNCLDSVSRLVLRTANTTFRAVTNVHMYIYIYSLLHSCFVPLSFSPNFLLHLPATSKDVYHRFGALVFMECTAILVHWQHQLSRDIAHELFLFPLKPGIKRAAAADDVAASGQLWQHHGCTGSCWLWDRRDFRTLTSKSSTRSTGMRLLLCTVHIGMVRFFFFPAKTLVP